MQRELTRALSTKALTKEVRQLKEVSPLASTRLTDKEFNQVRSLVDNGLYMSISDFVREAIREKLGGIKIIAIRDVNMKTAKKEILKYLEKRKGKDVYPSEVMEDLGIDIEVVLKVIEEFRKEGEVEEVK